MITNFFNMTGWVAQLI